MYGPLNIGLKNKRLPNTAERYDEMKTFYEKLNSGDPNCTQQIGMFNLIVDVERNFMKESKEHDAKMKQEIHRDHISEMFGGANFKKEPIKSEFQENFSKINQISNSVQNTQMR